MNQHRRIRAVIIDDEPLAREGVRMLLSQHGDIEVVGEAGNGIDAVELIRRQRPDLALLDVQMPQMSGLEVVKALPRDAVPVVVFITAYDRYAIDAFRVHALDYLLKPFDDDRFHDAIRRAKTHLELTRVNDLGERLLSMIAGGNGAHGANGTHATNGHPPGANGNGNGNGVAGGNGAHKFLTRLAIRDIGRVVFVNVDDIDWIEAADYYVQIHVGAKSYLHRETMQRLEAELDPERFIRIHRSAIVNQTRIRELRNQGRRDMVVVLSDGAELRVARSHREKLQRMR
jgi:two-component system LytT family response regulator